MSKKEKDYPYHATLPTVTVLGNRFYDRLKREFNMLKLYFNIAKIALDRSVEPHATPTSTSQTAAPYHNKASAMLLHYPNYSGGMLNGTQNKTLNKLNEYFGNPQLNVGHNAVITSDENGHTKYYEYGRYNPSTRGVIGYAKPNFGNVVNVPIPDKQAGETDSAYIARVQDKLPHSYAGTLLVNRFGDVNTDSINNYFERLANDSTRHPYSISLNPTTCATVANDAIANGLSESSKAANDAAIFHGYRDGTYTPYNILNPYSAGRYFNYYNPISTFYKFQKK